MENRPYPESVHDWSWETLESLEELAIQEDNYLEYKEHLLYPEEENEKSEAEWRRNIRNEFTAFANTSGGIIVFGMTDKAQPAPFQLPENEIDQYVSQLTQGTTPAVQTEVPSPIKVPSEGVERAVLPVRVKEANSKPVATPDSAFYIRNNGRKQPMNRELIGHLFVEADRRQQEVRQLEMEIDRFTDVFNQHFYDSSPNELPPRYNEIDTQSLRETLRENTHLYAQDDLSNTIRSIFRVLREIEQEERNYGRIRNGYKPNTHSDVDSLNYAKQRRLRKKAKNLKRNLDKLTKEAELSTSEEPIY